MFSEAERRRKRKRERRPEKKGGTKMSKTKRRKKSLEVGRRKRMLRSASRLHQSFISRRSPAFVRSIAPPRSYLLTRAFERALGREELSRS